MTSYGPTFVPAASAKGAAILADGWQGGLTA